MTTKGQQLYEKYRRHDVDAKPWNYLEQDDRDFWERLAAVL